MFPIFYTCKLQKSITNKLTYFLYSNQISTQTRSIVNKGRDHKCDPPVRWYALIHESFLYPDTHCPPQAVHCQCGVFHYSIHINEGRVILIMWPLRKMSHPTFFMCRNVVSAVFIHQTWRSNECWLLYNYRDTIHYS